MAQTQEVQKVGTDHNQFMNLGSFIMLIFAMITFATAVLGGKEEPEKGQMLNAEVRLGLFLSTIIFLLTGILFK